MTDEDDAHIRRGYPDYTDAQIKAYKLGYDAGWEYGRHKTPVKCPYSEATEPDLVRAFNMGAWTGDDNAVGRK